MPRLLGRGTPMHENRTDQRDASKAIFVLKRDEELMTKYQVKGKKGGS
jgi:hypothetical protein